MNEEIIKLRSFDHKKIKKIMIVDDSAINRTLLRRILEDMNDYYFIVASRGQESIDLYNKNKNIDLIFMDFHMPSMTGKEAIEKIRLLGYDKNIILLTGMIKEEIDKTIDVNYIILKPIHKNIIKKVFEIESIIK